MVCGSDLVLEGVSVSLRDAFRGRRNVCSRAPPHFFVPEAATTTTTTTPAFFFVRHDSPRGREKFLMRTVRVKEKRTKEGEADPPLFPIRKQQAALLFPQLSNFFFVPHLKPELCWKISLDSSSYLLDLFRDQSWAVGWCEGKICCTQSSTRVC